MSSVIRGNDNFDSGLGLGVGQTWQDMTASRAKSVAYVNNTTKPIVVSITVNTSAVGQSMTLTVDGVLAVNFASMQTYQHMAQCIIPVGATYTLGGTFGGTIAQWSELR